MIAAVTLACLGWYAWGATTLLWALAILLSAIRRRSRERAAQSHDRSEPS